MGDLSEKLTLIEAKNNDYLDQIEQQSNSIAYCTKKSDIIDTTLG